MPATSTRRYSEDEVEQISVIDLRVGDLLCERGPVGSGYYVATRVDWMQPPVHDTGWRCRTVRFTLAGLVDRDGHGYPYNQPESIKVAIVRRELVAS